MNLNIPTVANAGDFENHGFLRKVFTYCPTEMITAIQCRPAGVPDQGQKYSCDLDNGLKCINENQSNGLCLDYEIRYFCECGEEPITTTLATPVPTKVPTSSVGETTIEQTTIKMTTSTPKKQEKCEELESKCDISGWTDFMPASASNLRCNYKFCSKPASIDCRILNGEKGDEKVICNINDGFVCKGENCDLYHVRYYCDCNENATTPSPECSEGWSDWIDNYRPDQSGEIELIKPFISGNPMCHPAQIECKNDDNEKKLGEIHSKHRHQFTPFLDATSISRHRF